MPYRIPSPPFLGTMFITNRSFADGWSESYWIKGTPSGYNGALGNLRQVATARMAILTEEFECVYLRISDAMIRGDTLVEQLGGGLLVGTFGGKVDFGSLPSDDGLVLRVQGTTPTMHSSRFLHGIPDTEDEAASSRGFVNSARWRRPFNVYVDELKTHTVMIKRLAKGIPPAPDIIATPSDISTVTYMNLIKNRKVGRPFGLLRGRLVPR